MAYFRYRACKERPQTRYSISYMEEDAYTEDEIPIKTIYAGNLSSKITKKEVTEYFLKFGRVSSVAMKRTGSKRAPWFYAFVTFVEFESAAKALGLAKHEILSRRVVINAADSWIQPRENGAKCNRNKVSRDEASEIEFRLLHLNDDCLYQIGSFLELRDLINLSKTCKRLEYALEPCFASYKQLNTVFFTGLTLMQIREILYKIGPHVQHIGCTQDFELNGRRFEELLKKYCVNIVSLNCGGTCSLSKRLIQTFKNIKTLQCLAITDEMIAVLSNCKNLQNLNLHESTELTGKHLDKLSNLQNLNLDWCNNLQPEFFKNLCMKMKLVSLNIVGCERLDHSSIETLASTQTKLETLSISTNYQTSNLSPLVTLKNLKRLRIHCCGKNCDELLQELAKNRGAELEVLEIWECSFNQKVEQAIYSLKKLKELAVFCCKNITSMFLTKLALTSLVCLFICALEAIVEKDVLNLISKSENIKLIAGYTYLNADTQRLVLRSHGEIKKKYRKYLLGLLTKGNGPCIIDGIYHEEPELNPDENFRKFTKRLGYLGPLPGCIDFNPLSLMNRGLSNSVDLKW